MITPAPDTLLTDEIKLFGAASRVVYERLDPDSCTYDRWPALCATAEILRQWAREQEPAVREAYERAIDGWPGRAMGIVEQARARSENSRRSIIMHNAYNEIPKPPV